MFFHSNQLHSGVHLCRGRILSNGCMGSWQTQKLQERVQKLSQRKKSHLTIHYLNICTQNMHMFSAQILIRYFLKLSLYRLTGSFKFRKTQKNKNLSQNLNLQFDLYIQNEIVNLHKHTLFAFYLICKQIPITQKIMVTNTSFNSMVHLDFVVNYRHT